MTAASTTNGTSTQTSIASPAIDAKIAVRKTRGTAVDQLSAIAKEMLAWVEDRRFNGEFFLAIIPAAPARAEPLLSRLVDPALALEERRRQTIELAQDFYDYALHNMECHSLRQTYGVGAYERGRGEPKVLGRYDFPLLPTPGNAIGGLAQPANETGLLAQSMHMSEVSFGFCIQKGEREAERLIDQLDRANARIEVLQTKHMATIDLMESMMSQQLQRDLIRKQAEAELERVNQMWGTLQQVVLVVAKQKGLDIPDLMATPSKEISLAVRVQKWASSLSQEQILKISDILSSDQAGEFVALWQQMKAG